MKLILAVLSLILIINLKPNEAFEEIASFERIQVENLDSGLISSYYFNGDAIDELGIHSGTIHGASQASDRFGRLESAIEFDGVNDFVSFGLDFIDYDSMTISVWIYSSNENDSLEGDQFFICSGEPGVSTGVNGVWNDGMLLCGQTLAGSKTEESYHSDLLQNHWYNVVMVFDTIEKSSSTYVNGDLVNTSAYLVSSSIELSDSLFLGLSNFALDQGFEGKVDDLKIYNRVLSLSEIFELYVEGCPDSLIIDNINFAQDTALFARSWISIDTLRIDTGLQLYLNASEVKLDSSIIPLFCELTIQSIDGCNQMELAHKNHFQHRGIYINNFVSDSLLGNLPKEDSLLNWCQHNGFNNIYLYNIGSALSLEMDVELDSFVYKAHNMDNRISVTFVSAGFGTSFTNIEEYHDVQENIPTGIVSEIEFWNGGGTYIDDFEPWINKVNSLKYDTVGGAIGNPELQRRFYIGKIKNGGEPVSLDIAEKLVMNHDEIFLTNYHTDAFMLSASASENSIRNKLALLGEAGSNLGTKVNVVILFNVRQDSPAANIWNFFDEDSSDNQFSRAYTTFYLDFLAATDIDYKQYINLIGFGVYRYSDATAARDELD